MKAVGSQLVGGIGMPVDRIYELGFALGTDLPHGPCPVCGCRFGAHWAVMPPDTTMANLPDRAGLIECDSCEQACGFWTIPF